LQALQTEWLKRDRYSTEPIRRNLKRTDSGDEPIQHAEIQGTPMGTIENE
jgi:hypothetical protein